MLWGIGSYAYAWSIGVPGMIQPAQPMDAMAMMKRCHELGVSMAELCDNLPLHTVSDAELSGLIEAARAWGVEMRLGVRGIVPGLLERYLDLCQRTGSPTLRVVVDSTGHHPSPQEVMARLMPLLPHLSDAGVRLLIENHDRFAAQALADIMARLDSPWVGICLDTVNSFGALEGPQVVVETLKPWVGEVHIKDFTIERVGSNMGFTILGAPAGQGRLDVPWLLETLEAEQRGIAAIIELWPPFEFTLAETTALEDDWVAQSVAYMRELAG